jgi:hypothetical protein
VSGRRRVFLPLPPAELSILAADTDLPTAGRQAYAVTAVVRAAYPDQDEEELEYDALCVAAQSLAPSSGASAPVVLAADLLEHQVVDVVPYPGPAQDQPVEAEIGYAVRLTVALAAQHVVSIHVAEDADPDAELLWYDASELPHLADRLA